ncbi:Ubiquitin domain-containing protein UBFD1 [Tetrabaena socialis]|uniref:Ubiquitin domain-containing protein UBFD1 n=1 Tax=Tetrabaena socialis TaxID=47790 RepID=A0A2J7ZKC4_9CHLO|nr:Ubiquitin domain-containing protein UBFD1 [Tetrabaena socialis]|eukprot:PNH00712.1 Ubiquitin domain-containing protein UBFD1 [Tetrabaena socialis]
MAFSDAGALLAVLLKAADAILQAGVKNGCKLLLIGSNPSAVDAAKGASSGAAGEWTEAPKNEEPLHKQTQHAKVLAKGVPDGALPGIAGRQVPLDDKITAIPALLNSQGSKVRLTFKEELQQLWLGSEASTQKVPYGSISKIESWPVEGNEGYSIVAIHLGVGGTSKYWLYYFPSQYVAGVKIRILGVQSLI